MMDFSTGTQGHILGKRLEYFQILAELQIFLFIFCPFIVNPGDRRQLSCSSGEQSIVHSEKAARRLRQLKMKFKPGDDGTFWPESKWTVPSIGRYFHSSHRHDTDHIQQVTTLLRNWLYSYVLSNTDVVTFLITGNVGLFRPPSMVCSCPNSSDMVENICTSACKKSMYHILSRPSLDPVL